MEERKKRFRHLDFIGMDVAVLLVSFFLAYILRFHMIVPINRMGRPYLHQILIVILGYVLIIGAHDPYKDAVSRDYVSELQLAFMQTLYLLLFDIVCLYFIREVAVMPRQLIVLEWVIFFVCDCLAKCLLKRHIRKKMQRSEDKRMMVVISSSDRANSLLYNLNRNPLNPYTIKGIFLTDLHNNARYGQHDLIEDIPILGRSEDAISYCSHHWVDEVTLDLPDDPESASYFLKNCELMGITTHRIVAVLRQNERESGDQYAEMLGDYVTLTRTIRTVPAWQYAVKRAMDIVGGLIGCAVTGILFLFVAPPIYISSPGPIFFAQKRIGKNGKPFRMYKFRSMYMDAEERKKALMEKNKISSGMMFKMDDDPRIIGSEKKDKNGKPKGIGNFIRNTSIDEFPQFFNVLKGDMSLVGTRPPTVDEWEHYKPEYRSRMSIRPGITGMWQISGRSNITDFDKVVALDNKYIQTWTVGMDLRILLRTVGAVAKSEGAE